VSLPFRLVVAQGIVVATITMLFLVCGRAYALASLAAGVVVIVPGTYFAWRVVASNATHGAELGTARQLLGDGVAKLLLTFGLLVVAFAGLRPDPLAFFATMIVLQAVYWLAPLLERP